MHKDTTELTETQKKRLYLSELSRDAETIRTAKVQEATTIEAAAYWESKTVNYFLTNFIYPASEGTKVYKTFHDWKKEGATVKKGEKAFLIWGSPIYATHQKEVEKAVNEKDNVDEYEFFPLCYVFSENQVVTAQERIKAKEARQEAQQEPEPVPELEPITDDFF